MPSWQEIQKGELQDKAGELRNALRRLWLWAQQANCRLQYEKVETGIDGLQLGAATHSATQSSMK